MLASWGAVKPSGVQASVNPKAETVEELQGRRKQLHMGMLKLAREDLSFALLAALDAFQVHLPRLAKTTKIMVQHKVQRIDSVSSHQAYHSSSVTQTARTEKGLQHLATRLNKCTRSRSQALTL